jgi:hypothetical protein
LAVFYGQASLRSLARLFSTVAYARQIVFLEKEAAHIAIDKISAINAGVEQKRTKDSRLGIQRSSFYAYLLFNCIIPDKVLKLLSLKRFVWFTPTLKVYKLARYFKLDGFIKLIIIPSKFQGEIKNLDAVNKPK